MEAASPQPDAIAKIQNRWAEFKELKAAGKRVDPDIVAEELNDLAGKANIDSLQLIEILFGGKNE